MNKHRRTCEFCDIIFDSLDDHAVSLILFKEFVYILNLSQVVFYNLSKRFIYNGIKRQRVLCVQSAI